MTLVLFSKLKPQRSLGEKERGEKRLNTSFPVFMCTIKNIEPDLAERSLCPLAMGAAYTSGVPVACVQLVVHTGRYLPPVFALNLARRAVIR